MLIAPAPPVPIVTVDRPTQVSAYGSGVLFPSAILQGLAGRRALGRREALKNVRT